MQYSQNCGRNLSILPIVKQGTYGWHVNAQFKHYKPSHLDILRFVEAPPLANSLDEALQALESDTVLVEALGEEFVQW